MRILHFEDSDTGGHVRNRVRREAGLIGHALEFLTNARDLAEIDPAEGQRSREQRGEDGVRVAGDVLASQGLVERPDPPNRSSDEEPDKALNPEHHAIDRCHGGHGERVRGPVRR